MAALLLSRGVSVDATNPQGYTLLMLGSVHGSVPLVKLAIDKGADVNKRSVGGGTALHQARISTMTLHYSAHTTHKRLITDLCTSPSTYSGVLL